MGYFSEIEADLDWREAELSILRLMLVSNSTSNIERRVVIRASWALLYAHFEGFCKFALTVYFDALTNSGVKCEDLPQRTKAFSLGAEINKFRSLPSENLLDEIDQFQSKHLSEIAQFPEIDTKSNLYPSTLSDLLLDADLVLEELANHTQKIKTLVKRRNKIAHGEKEIIDDLNYYMTYEDAVKTLMYELALAIDAKLTPPQSSPATSSQPHAPSSPQDAA